MTKIFIITLFLIPLFSTAFAQEEKTARFYKSVHKKCEKLNKYRDENEKIDCKAEVEIEKMITNISVSIRQQEIEQGKPKQDDLYYRGQSIMFIGTDEGIRKVANDRGVSNEQLEKITMNMILLANHKKDKATSPKKMLSYYECEEENLYKYKKDRKNCKGEIVIEQTIETMVNQAIRNSNIKDNKKANTLFRRFILTSIKTNIDRYMVQFEQVGLTKDKTLGLLNIKIAEDNKKGITYQKAKDFLATVKANLPNNHHRGGKNKDYTLDYIKYNRSELYFDNKKIAILEIPKDKKYWSYTCLNNKKSASGFDSVVSSVKEAKIECIK